MKVEKSTEESAWLELELGIVQSYPLALAFMHNEYRNDKTPIRSLCKKIGVRVHANKAIGEQDLSKCELVLERALQKRGQHRRVKDELFCMFYGGIQKLMRFYHCYTIYDVEVRKAERIILVQNDKWVDTRFIENDKIDLIINAFADEYYDYSSDAWKEMSSHDKCVIVAEQHSKLMDGNSAENAVRAMIIACNEDGVEPEYIGEKYSQYLRQQQFRNTDAKYISNFVNFISRGKWREEYPIDPQIHLTDLAEHIEVAAFFQEVCLSAGISENNVVKATVKELKDGKRKGRKKKGS
jgi:hypothetical protein